MNFKPMLLGALLAAAGGQTSLFGAADAVKPVTPNASPEAVALLEFIHGLSGKQTLTGQHNFPNTKDTSTLEAARAYGKIPAIYGQDFGFAAPGDKDATTARPDIVAECKRQYARGSIITLCWHAVPPTADEPVTFLPKPGASTSQLASVQGRLTDAQWHDLLTPGTDLHQHWCRQVDVIAGYLKQLQQAHVPVLWRPYHEMNGEWFWWGGRRGKAGTVALYRQLFDRLVNHHKLTNLVWIWSVDRPSTPQRQFADYNPGSDYFDIAALDVYRSDFQQSYYEELLRLAAGKPIALAEVGPPPTVTVLAQQPKWTWWMLWAGMVRNGPASEPIKALYDDPRSWSLSDSGYRNAITPLRAVSGLLPLRPAPTRLSQ